MNLLYEKAWKLAFQWHGEQKWGNRPYIDHLDDVYNIHNRHCVSSLAYSYALGIFTPDGLYRGEAEKTIAHAIYLHDSLEDTGHELSEIMAIFGEDVGNLVWRLTDEPGKNRGERKRKTYAKIKGDIRAIAIKMCDRESNVRFAWQCNPKLLKMYQNEYEEFEYELRCGDLFAKQWEQLRKLHFEGIA